MSARVLLLAALALPVAAACSMGEDSSTSASRAGAATADASDAAIDSVMAKYIAAVESGDTAAIAATLSEDAEVVFPTGPLHGGLDAAGRRVVEDGARVQSVGCTGGSDGRARSPMEDWLALQ